ncbi:rCG57970 [Rattus norvegicus]|uniref:RCG57970 n=1 Tax=Rattus norvegicus TaxID=10116 RepID=A6J3V9_RAT|nr:rCG57970 [Rattus norvegicus]
MTGRGGRSWPGRRRAL